MKKNKENYMLKEIEHLKKEKQILLNQTSDLNNLIAELFFFNAQSKAINKTQELFISRLNHEIKTPLNAILGFSQLIDDEVFGPIKNKKYKEYIKYIISGGQTLLDLINNMLYFSKLEMNQISLDEKNVDIINLLNEVILLTKKAYSFKKRDIFIHTNKHFFLKADETMLKQIFLNILSNAIKFTKNNGKIDIYFRKMPKAIRFIFKDNGCGIERSKLKSIFDPFSENKKTFSKTQQGMGLGLVLVKKMVILHQGIISIKSVKNKGTLLIIDFPIERFVL